ncbi:RNA polymerase sigma factor [Paenibacillus sp. 1-18]|uniref:RNA polymerase sigma factor n=1 Tax=Paenibacillus sp. 1-18 TaxID=1333846 RepID=UPI0004B51FC3|nr:sigma factor-like helix-turn-helix DNA-binding protein [Paenibacillus sp. 1-18]
MKKEEGIIVYNMEQEYNRAQRGDHEALIQLCRRLELELYGLAKAIIEHDEDFVIAFQKTILQVYRGMHSLRGTEHFKTRVIRILIYECNQIMHSRRGTDTIKESPHDFEKSTQAVNVQQMKLREAVNQLEKDFRIVIHLSYFQKLSIKQISYVLNIDEAEVKMRLHKARELLTEWSLNSRLIISSQVHSLIHWHNMLNLLDKA